MSITVYTKPQTFSTASNHFNQQISQKNLQNPKKCSLVVVFVSFSYPERDNLRSPEQQSAQ